MIACTSHFRENPLFLIWAYAQVGHDIQFRHNVQPQDMLKSGIMFNLSIIFKSGIMFNLSIMLNLGIMPNWTFFW